VRGLRAAAGAAAALALVGTLTFVAVRDEADPPPSTTTTTTTTIPTDEELAAVVTDALTGDLDVPLSDAQARCVADGVVELLGSDRLLGLADGAAAGLDGEERAALVRTVVLCVPEDAAEALLGTGTTTTAIAQLPDEGE